jgi:hypothetical protein
LLAALHTLCKFGVPETVPIDGEMTLEELGTKTGLSLDMLTRLVRLGVANYVFVEPKRGVIAHNARSKLLATDDGAAVGHNIPYIACNANKSGPFGVHRDGKYAVPLKDG